MDSYSYELCNTQEEFEVRYPDNRQMLQYLHEKRSHIFYLVTILDMVIIPRDSRKKIKKIQAVVNTDK